MIYISGSPKTLNKVICISNNRARKGVINPHAQLHPFTYEETKA